MVGHLTPPKRVILPKSRMVGQIMEAHLTQQSRRMAVRLMVKLKNRLMAVLRIQQRSLMAARLTGDHLTRQKHPMEGQVTSLVVTNQEVTSRTAGQQLT